MPTIDTAEMPRIESRRDVLLEVLGRHRIRAEWLADGTLVATVGRGNATDDATRAVRCALEVRARWPEAKIAVTTARWAKQSRIPVGTAIDRACQLLKSMPACEAVLLDDRTASVLDLRHHLTQRSSSGWLLKTFNPLSDSARTHARESGS